MDWRLQIAIAVAMLAVAGAMIFYDRARSQSGRPLIQNEVLAIPYWITYLSLIVLGGCFGLAAIIH